MIREGLAVSDPNTWKLGPSATPAALRAAAQALVQDPMLLGEIRAEMEALERERFGYGRLLNRLDEQRALLDSPPAADN